MFRSLSQYFCRTTLLLFTLLTVSVATSLAQAEQKSAVSAVQGWSVVKADGSCRLESALAPINDGYMDIQVQLRFDGQGLWALTPSTIDTEGDFLGLQVDDKAVNVAATVEAATNVLFSGDIDAAAQGFVRGGEAQLLLRFWPTWPITGTKTIRYSLKGFTAAWKDYAQCR